MNWPLFCDTGVFFPDNLEEYDVCNDRGTAWAVAAAMAEVFKSLGKLLGVWMPAHHRMMERKYIHYSFSLFSLTVFFPLSLFLFYPLNYSFLTPFRLPLSPHVSLP